MATINLKDYYPEIYKTDYYLNVDAAVKEALDDSRKQERAALRRMYWHSAHYSLDRGDSIENSILDKPLPLWAEFEQRLTKIELYNALLELPTIQFRRLYAYYFLDKSMAEIAREENVHHSTVALSIKKALCNMLNHVRFPF